MVLVLLLATLLRLPTLGGNSIWLDEAHLVWQGEKSLTAIWLTDPDMGHPPLYYALFHFWLALGQAEWLVRLPSALCSILGVALVWQVGRKLGGEKVGVAAAALLAVAPLDVWYAQEGRMYAAVLTASLALAFFLADWSTSDSLPSPLSSLLFGLVLATGLYLDFPMIVMWGGLSGLWLGWWWHGGRGRTPLRAWLIGSLSGWGLFLPGLWYVQKLTQALNSMVPLPASLATPLWLLLILGLPLAISTSTVILLWPYVLATKAGQRHAGGRGTQFRLLLAAAFVTVVVGNLLLLWPRLYLVKRLTMILWPYLLLLVGWGLVYYRQKRLLAGLGLFSLVITVIMLATIPKDDWRSVVVYVNDAAAPGDVIWLSSGGDGLPYNYYQPRYPAYVGSFAELQNAAAHTSSVWLIAGVGAGNPLFQPWLEDQAQTITITSFYRLSVIHYQLRHATPTAKPDEDL